MLRALARLAGGGTAAASSAAAAAAVQQQQRHCCCPWQQQTWQPAARRLLAQLRAAQQPPPWPAEAARWQRQPAATAAAAQLQTWRRSRSAAEQARERNRKGITDGAMYLGAVVLGMVGFSYASVPLYRAFCQATGYGGAVGKAHNIEGKLRAREEAADAALEAKCAARELRVWFSSDVAEDMPWRFRPTQDYVTVRPGESALAFFTAENLSPRAITGVSTYNVVPDKAAYYFNKVQCFCFEEQRLRGGEVVDMPVFFYIDPELVEDHNCRNVHDITLSYTFFKVDEDEDGGGTEVEAAGAVAEEGQAAGGGVKLHGTGQLPAGVAPPPGGGGSGSGGAWSSGSIRAPPAAAPAAAGSGAVAQAEAAAAAAATAAGTNGGP